MKGPPQQWDYIICRDLFGALLYHPTTQDDVLIKILISCLNKGFALNIYTHAVWVLGGIQPHFTRCAGVVDTVSPQLHVRCF